MKIGDPGTRDALAAEYVLGTLRGKARAGVARRIEADPDWRQRAARWEQALQPLADAVPPVAPPPRAWEAIVARLGFQGRASAGFFGRWRFAVAGLAVAVAAALLWTPLSQRLLFSPDVAITLQNEQHQAVWRVEADTRRNTLSVVALQDVPLARDKSLELWLLKDGQAPVSLGLMPVQRGGARLERVAVALGTGVGYAVTLEPLGGSPHGVATGPILYVQKLERHTG